MERGGLARDTEWAMSEENADIVRRGYDAFDRRDLETLAEIVSDDFELDISSHPIPDFPNTGVGRDHLFRFFATYLSGFSEYEITVTELVQAGDMVVALLHDKAKLGNATVERDLAHIWTINSGRAVRVQAFTTHEAALEAAGLPE
jgi:ketosteroid isomerase-like protein